MKDDKEQKDPAVQENTQEETVAENAGKETAPETENRGVEE